MREAKIKLFSLAILHVQIFKKRNILGAMEILSGKFLKNAGRERVKELCDWFPGCCYVVANVL